MRELEVVEVTHYTDKLFRIKLERPRDYRFIAGEFTMIGLEDTPSRAYSFTSGPYDDFLEFYSIKVPNGPLTSKLKYIEPGKLLKVGEKPTGTLITANLELAKIDNAFQVSDEEALPIVFDLHSQEGLLLGGSSAINVAGAIRLAKELGPGKTIVTILCDSGARYFSKLWNPNFLKEKNLPIPSWL